MKLHRVLIVAGEASGDQHGAGVVRELRGLTPGVDVYGVGGDAMLHAGMDVVVHIRELSFMGFIEVVRNLATVFRVERELDRLLKTRPPDVVVLIDYPGFNLRFAKRVKARGIPVLYYISPQVWAWRSGRLRVMRSLVDRMKVVFPFEVDLYKQAGVPVEFVGHPLAEHLKLSPDRMGFLRRHGLDPSRKLLGLFPGSREQELERILHPMVRGAALLQRQHDLQVAVSVAPNLGRDTVRRHLPAGVSPVLVERDTHGLMQHSDAAVVTSGTATLETGWFGTPMVVVYRTSPVTYLIGRMLVHVPSIGLVNIVAGERIVPELIQGELTEERVAVTVSPLLYDSGTAALIRSRLAVIRDRLGVPGASLRVARGIIELAEAA